MIAHVVLFRPRTDLSTNARQALMASFEAALTQIPSIRRARVGRRIVVGRGYESFMRVDYAYAAVIEFDDRAGLMAYLEHPVHERLASQFFSAFEEALMYDFELADGTDGLAVLPDSQ
jgi:stress responsive alpha/beta barrel protein